jgi:preprotein translocase subunit SecD
VDDYSGEPVLALAFTGSGNAKFLRAQRCGVGRPIEISIDRTVVSRPILNEPVTGGKANISGGWQSLDAVQAVAARILKR